MSRMEIRQHAPAGQERDFTATYLHILNRRATPPPIPRPVTLETIKHSRGVATSYHYAIAEPRLKRINDGKMKQAVEDYYLNGLTPAEITDKNSQFTSQILYNWLRGKTALAKQLIVSFGFTPVKTVSKKQPFMEKSNETN